SSSVGINAEGVIYMSNKPISVTRTRPLNASVLWLTRYRTYFMYLFVILSIEALKAIIKRFIYLFILAIIFFDSDLCIFLRIYSSVSFSGLIKKSSHRVGDSV